MTNKLSLAREVLRLRVSQILINDRYKAKLFRVPIHLALGHEAIAVGVASARGRADQLVLPHRNLHYNLACGAALRAIVNEFLLLESGLAGGKYGSMNLINPKAGIIYSSSILGNNLCVSTGVALAEKVTSSGAATFVVTGDGAMEEGAFYETLLLAVSQELPIIVIVENNEWSLASKIDERRAPIDVGGLAQACGADYLRLAGNDVFKYAEALSDARQQVLAAKRPVVIETILKTLGDWRQPTQEFPEGKYINYHAGPAPTVEFSAWPVFGEGDADPLQVLATHFSQAELVGEVEVLRKRLEGDLS